jgi:hypothetical protein
MCEVVAAEQTETEIVDPPSSNPQLLSLVKIRKGTRTLESEVVRCNIQVYAKVLIVFLVEALLGFVEGHVRVLAKEKKVETAEK